MLILVPLKTQENAVAKWKGKKNCLPNGKQLYFQDLRTVLQKLESKTERGKRNEKKSCFLYLAVWMDLLPRHDLKKPCTDHLENTGSLSWQICRSLDTFHRTTSKKKPLLLLSPSISSEKTWTLDSSGGPIVANPPSSAGDTGPIPGLGRFHILQGS